MRLSELATILRREGRYADAEHALTRALAIEQPAPARAMTLNTLGLIYITLDRLQDAAAPLAEAFAIRTRTLARDDALTLETLANLAVLDSAMARHPDAEAKLRDALGRAEAREPVQPHAVALHAALLAD